MPTFPAARTTDTNNSLPLKELANLEERLNREIIGQSKAVQIVANALKAIVTQFNDPQKPTVMLFAGPTGVGKTTLGERVAIEMDRQYVRFEMATFSEGHKVSTFLGSPSGYVDSDKEGALVGALRKHPRAVVLFDEIEKAHADVRKVFLSLFDTGRLTDSRNREVIANQAIFILTTNLGSREIQLAPQEENKMEKLRLRFINFFSPEVFNRMDNIIVFDPLNQKSIEIIIEKYFKQYQSHLANTRNYTISWDQTIIVHLAALQLDISMGARESQRIVKKHIIPLLVENFIKGKILEVEAKVHFSLAEKTIQLIVLEKGKNGKSKL